MRPTNAHSQNPNNMNFIFELLSEAFAALLMPGLTLAYVYYYASKNPPPKVN